MSHLLEVEGLTTAFDSDFGRTVSVDHVNFQLIKERWSASSGNPDAAKA